MGTKAHERTVEDEKRLETAERERDEARAKLAALVEAASGCGNRPCALHVSGPYTGLHSNGPCHCKQRIADALTSLAPTAKERDERLVAQGRRIERDEMVMLYGGQPGDSLAETARNYIDTQIAHDIAAERARADAAEAERDHALGERDTAINALRVWEDRDGGPQRERADAAEARLAMVSEEATKYQRSAGTIADGVLLRAALSATAPDVAAWTERVGSEAASRGFASGYEEGDQSGFARGIEAARTALRDMAADLRDRADSFVADELERKAAALSPHPAAPSPAQPVAPKWEPTVDGVTTSDNSGPVQPWGSLPTDAVDPNYGRECICGAPIRAGERYAHHCSRLGPAQPVAVGTVEEPFVWPSQDEMRDAWPLWFAREVVVDAQTFGLPSYLEPAALHVRLRQILSRVGPPPIDHELLRAVAKAAWMSGDVGSFATEDGQRTGSMTLDTTCDAIIDAVLAEHGKVRR